jgi:hypothetical protein
VAAVIWERVIESLVTVNATPPIRHQMDRYIVQEFVVIAPTIRILQIIRGINRLWLPENSLVKVNVRRVRPDYYLCVL